MNNEETFDDHINTALGHYVYALKDPRDNIIFYVGVGQNSRVLNHFGDARIALVNPEIDRSEKIKKIISIWDDDQRVVWLIIRRNLPSQQIAFQMEAGLIDLLDLMQGSKLLNIQRGHFNAEHGLLDSIAVGALAAPPVRPRNFYNRPIFILPIHNALQKLQSVETDKPVNERLSTDDLLYGATKKAWPVNEIFYEANNAIAVGVVNGVSQCVFQINSWSDADQAGLFAFEGSRLYDQGELQSKSYRRIIECAQGFWGFGNYLIVEFNEGEYFRYLRGSSNREWQLL